MQGFGNNIRITLRGEFQNYILHWSVLDCHANNVIEIFLEVNIFIINIFYTNRRKLLDAVKRNISYCAVFVISPNKNQRLLYCLI